MRWREGNQRLSWLCDKCRLSSSDSAAGASAESESSRRGTARSADHGQGGNCRAASSPQRRTWFQGCGSKTGKRIPYLETFPLAADPVLPASEPSGPRPLFSAVDGGRQ